MYADEGVVFEHILETIVFGELDGVELTQFNFTSFPFSKQLIEHIFSTVRLALDHHDASLRRYLIGDFA